MTDSRCWKPAEYAGRVESYKQNGRDSDTSRGKTVGHLIDIGESYAYSLAASTSKDLTFYGFFVEQQTQWTPKIHVFDV